MRLLSELHLVPLSWRWLQDWRLRGCSRHLVHVLCLQGTGKCQHCTRIRLCQSLQISVSVLDSKMHLSPLSVCKSGEPQHVICSLVT